MSLDLDVDNYNERDLETFFKITAANADYATIELKETQIREQLLSSGHIQSAMKRDLIRFLTAAKNKLVDLKKLKKTPPVGAPNADAAAAYTPNAPPRTGELNKRERVQYVYAQNSDFLPGTVNPIQTRVISKCLTIDTRYRGNYFTTPPTDFNFQLPMTINRVVSMELSSFEIPFTFYNISSSNGNNYLYAAITYYDADNVLVKYAKVFTLANGNYTATTLVNALNLAIRGDVAAPADNTTDPDEMMALVQFVYGMEATTNTGNGKSYLTTTSTNTLSIELDFTVGAAGVCDNVDYTTKIGWNLGFTKRQYSFIAENVIQPPVFSIASVPFPPAFVFSGESDAPVEMATTRYLYLAIDDYNRNVNDLFNTAFCVSVMSPDVIARIPIKGAPMSMLVENNLSVVSQPRIYFGPVDVQRMRVRLYDDRGRIVQMNNADFSFCLVFKIVYDL